MSTTAVVTARLDRETLMLVDRVAQSQGRTRSAFVARAIKRIAQTEADFLNFIQEGIDSADRGDVVSQEEMERWFEERVAARAVVPAA